MRPLLRPHANGLNNAKQPLSNFDEALMKSSEIRIVPVLVYIVIHSDLVRVTRAKLLFVRLLPRPWPWKLTEAL